MTNVKFAGATNVGRVRKLNEDSYSIRPDENLIIVCDGMGGHAAGEIASQLAVETITEFFAGGNMEMFDRQPFSYPTKITPKGKLLIGAIALANLRIINKASQFSEHSGMGTTAVVCYFGDQLLSLCHVGDSRAYLVRDQSIKRITVDHSWVSELMEKHQISEAESEQLVNRNVITRALGTKPESKIDISELGIRVGDIFLLCSDGLTGMVSDSQILRTALAHADDLQLLVNNLIDQANEAGGVDNITVVVGQIVEHDPSENVEEVKRVTVEWEENEPLDRLEEIVSTHYNEVTTPVTAKPKSGIKAKGSQIIILLAIIIIIAIVILILQFVEAG